MTREEAIRRIKSWNLNSDDMEVLSVVIPELSESNEEEIRERLVEYFKGFYDKYYSWNDGNIRWEGLEVKKVIAYLEKQKTSEEAIRYVKENHSPNEVSDFQAAMNIAVAKAYDKGVKDTLEKQKAKERLDRMAPIYNDKESFESALEKAWKYYNESASRKVDSFEDDYIECVFSKGFREGFLYKEKKKEQKLDDVKKEWWNKGYFKGRKYAHIPAKELGLPSSWDFQQKQKSVEYIDKNKVYTIITELTILSYSQLIPINSNEFKRIQDITSEVRSLLDYPIKQKPAEWSEEDEKILDELLDHCNTENATWYNWLKSLRPPQYCENCKLKRSVENWKPSKEQISDLECIVKDLHRDYLYEDRLKPIDDLIENLKKLM